jgi:threonylcarbamoyladenosine tRNA methylthiotransferase MtaB
MDTYRFIEDLPLSYCHVFTYSERPGTLAAKYEEKVRDSVKTERSHRLHRLSERKKEEFYQANAGQIRPVLWESDHHNGYMYGFTDNYIKVKTAYDDSLVNVISPFLLGRLTPEMVFVEK